MHTYIVRGGGLDGPRRQALGGHGVGPRAAVRVRADHVLGDGAVDGGVDLFGEW